MKHDEQRTRINSCWCTDPLIICIGVCLSRKPARDITRLRLTELRVIAERLRESGTDLRSFNSLEELLDFANKNNIVDREAYEDRWYSFDSWRKPIVMKIFRDGDNLVVSFISSGPNQVFEDGSGDDLVSTIVIESKHR